MIGNDLPPELAAIEQALKGGHQPAPSLQTRVMVRVHAELRSSRRQGFWSFAAAVAACVLLLLNVSVSLAAMPRQVLSENRSAPSSLYEQISRMQLGLSDEDIRRQCLLMATGDELILSGTPRGSATGTSMGLNQ